MEIKADLSADSVDVSIDDKLHYSPAQLVFQAEGKRIELACSDELLEQIGYEIHLYLTESRDHENPDQQRVLNAEHEEGTV